MRQDHRLQQQRFELKYLVPEGITLAIRDFLGSFLEIDEYGAEQADLSYPVHSLYLDSDDLKTYHATINGTKNRFKLRLRYYDARPESPVFFEIKRRVNNCILKQRGPVRREAVGRVLTGHLPEAEDLASGEPRHRVAVQRFCELVQLIRAHPKAHNHYRREAWVNPCDNSIRVTIDRGMRLEPQFDANLSTRIRSMVSTFGADDILELKFTERFPNWFGDLVRRFNLMQFAAAKYAEGITVLGESRFRAPATGDAASQGVAASTRRPAAPAEGAGGMFDETMASQT
jgi:VTC domain